MNKIYFLAVGLLLLVLSYTALVFAGSDEAIRLGSEDSIIENMSIFFWLFGSILLFRTYYFSKSEDCIYLFKWKRNFFFLLLAISFLFCCGEEFSWGQRIIGFKTSELMRIHNAQHEFNIHNMWIFQGYDHQMNPKTGINKWLTSGRIFSLIWLFYCFLIPVLYNLSHFWRKTIANIYFPVIPVWIGVLFLFNHFISKFFENTGILPARPVIELKETLFALLYLSAALTFCLQMRKKNTAADSFDNTINFSLKLKSIPLFSGQSAKIIINQFLSMLSK